MRRATLMIVAAVVAALAWQGVSRAEDKKDPSDPQVGKAAPQFELKDLAGASHSLADFKGKIVVLHFQSMHCPWEHAYQSIINGVASKYASAKNEAGETVEVVFIALNANKNEGGEKLQGYATDKPVPYLLLKDEGAKVADQYAARTTPHIYVIDGEQVLRYKGGIEKAPLGPDKVGQSEDQYLEPVLAALVAGKEPPVTDTQSIGCTIKR